MLVPFQNVFLVCFLNFLLLDGRKILKSKKIQKPQSGHKQTHCRPRIFLARTEPERLYCKYTTYQRKEGRKIHEGDKSMSKEPDTSASRSVEVSNDSKHPRQNDDGDDVVMTDAPSSQEEPGQGQQKYQPLSLSSSSSSNPPMVLSPALQFPINSRVIIHGLQNAKHFNQELAIVEDYLMDEGRYKLSLLSRAAKQRTRSKSLSVRPAQLRSVSSSAFISNISESRTGKILVSKIPFECHVTWDDDNEQMVVQVLYANFLGDTVKEEMQKLLNANYSCYHEDDEVFEILNSPIDYEEHGHADQYFQGDELLVLSYKPIIGDLYEAMLEYQLLRELDTDDSFSGQSNNVVHVGLHGAIPLCRLNFPYPFEGSFYFNDGQSESCRNQDTEHIGDNDMPHEATTAEAAVSGTTTTRPDNATSPSSKAVNDDATKAENGDGNVIDPSSKNRKGDQ